MQLPLVLLLLSLPGCLSIQGPESVRGLEGGSVTVRCDYKPRWETYGKWWCRGAYWELCRTLVRTTGSQLEVKGDRVSIGDNQSHHFLTVTMEKVRQDDTDTYWCGISKSGPDLGAPIRVTIEPVMESNYAAILKTQQQGRSMGTVSRDAMPSAGAGQLPGRASRALAAHECPVCAHNL
ncbi:CMRF35-like molecule 7 isoform X3 [Lynx rufus]|uniref:CMRF35-like molecule 7 isoform X3 n=1 Tax=Lynx rufus TaxID=61384 RepID=UPI001F12436D|nr:CMRF35-like molecule 7 isoform X3 [Lynx rufus]